MNAIEVEMLAAITRSVRAKGVASAPLASRALSGAAGDLKLDNKQVSAHRCYQNTPFAEKSYILHHFLYICIISCVYLAVGLHTSSADATHLFSLSLDADWEY